MNDLSKQPYRLTATIASILMVFALFMPAFSFMGKYEASFWEVIKQISDSLIGGQSGPNGGAVALFFSFLFMLLGPILTLIKALANEKTTTITASIPLVALLLFMIILSSNISSGSRYVNLSEVIQYKIGFYVYLLSAITLLVTHMMWPKEGQDESGNAATFSAQKEANLRPNSQVSGMTRLLHTDWMTEFMPLKFMDNYEIKHFGEVCAGHPLASKVSRFSLLAGLIMIFFINEFLSRLDSRLMPNDLLLATLAVTTAIACLLLWPVMMRAVTIKNKVVYCLLILLTAIACAYLGFRFAVLVLIYVVVYLVIYAIRKYRNS